MNTVAVNDPDPFSVTTTRNPSGTIYVVRIGYKIRREVTVEGERGFTDDPHPKVLDFRLVADSDTEAITRSLECLPDQSPVDVHAPDRIEVLELKIVERPSLQ